MKMMISHLLASWSSALASGIIPLCMGVYVLARGYGLIPSGGEYSSEKRRQKIKRNEKLAGLGLIILGLTPILRWLLE